jgi:hypothetical protein
LFPYRLVRFLSNYLRSLISTLKSKLSKIKLLVVRCSNSMHYIVLLMIYYKNKNLLKFAVDHKLTEGIVFTMQFPTATVKKTHKRSTRNCGGIKGKNNTRRNFQDRLGHCLVVEGKHFEHFL